MTSAETAATKEARVRILFLPFECKGGTLNIGSMFENLTLNSRLKIALVRVLLAAAADQGQESTRYSSDDDGLRHFLPRYSF